MPSNICEYLLSIQNILENSLPEMDKNNVGRGRFVLHLVYIAYTIYILCGKWYYNFKNIPLPKKLTF